MKDKEVKNRLLRVERFVVLYSKDWDAPLKEFNIDNIPLDKIREIVTPKKDDYLLYDGYVLDNIQLKKINKLIDNKIDLNIDLYNYVLECNGIYNWT